jgi:ABC-type uncharacterized transport system substrate-binding protein
VKTRAALAVFAALLQAAAASAAAPPIQAVLSADTRPYQEAWEGFHAELGDDAAMSVAGARGSDAAVESARVVVAFGSKAALKNYPGGAKVIIVMAPSVASRRYGPDDAPQVSMTPSPAILLANLRALQPGLKRLAVLWKSGSYGELYLPLIRQAGKEIGVQILSIEIGEESGIPDQLRALYGLADALWLPPDPLVISQNNFVLLRDFSLSNRIPLYVPIPSLAELGATASVGVGFRAVGRSAARAALQALAGAESPKLSFPEPAETVLNSASASKVGLAVDAQTLKKLSRVIP